MTDLIAYYNRLEVAEIAQRQQPLLTLSRRHNDTLRYLPRLGEEIEQMLTPRAGVDYERLASQLKGPLQQATEFVKKLKALTEPINADRRVRDFLERTMRELTSHTVADFDQRLEELCATLHNEAAQQRLAAQRENEQRARAKQDEVRKVAQERERKRREATHKLTGHLRAVRAVVFIPDACSGLVASASNDGSVLLWDTAIGAQRRQLEIGHPVTSLAASADGRWLASGDNSGTVSLWDVHTGHCDRRHEDAVEAIHALACSPAGDHRLAAGGADGVVYLWDGAGAAKRMSLRHGPIYAVAFHPNGAMFGCARSDGSVQLLQTDELRVLREFDTGDWINTIAFSPLDDLLAVGGNDGTILLYRTQTGKLHQAIEASGGWVLSLCFSEDGQLLVSGHQDGTVRVWNQAGKAERQSYIGHTGSVNAVAISHHSRWICSAGDDKTVQLWWLDYR